MEKKRYADANPAIQTAEGARVSGGASYWPLPLYRREWFRSMGLRSGRGKKQIAFVALIITVFLAIDGSSSVALSWEGAPPCYLPVGLSVALLLCCGPWAIPLVLFCSVVAASLNYHRALLSWSGLPGAVVIYLGYISAALILKSRWRSDLRKGSLQDVVRYMAACFGGSIVSTVGGVLTLFGDGRIQRSEILKTSFDWWVSDELSITAFAPFLILFVAPFIGDWLHTPGKLKELWQRLSMREAVEGAVQIGLVAFVIWFAFGYASAIPYQPLYLLFLPMIWVSVRRGLRGAVLTTFCVTMGMTIAAWLTHAPHGALPHFQLATLALGLTGLFLGAVVTEGQHSELAIRKSERRYRLLFERNLAGVFRTTVDGRFLECNPAAALLFGFESKDVMLGASAMDLYENSSDRRNLLARLAIEKNITNHEMRLRRKDGTVVWAILNITLTQEAPGVSVIEGTIVDISKRKVAEERALSLAYYDPLTTLPNRTLLQDRLSQAIATARRRHEKMAVLFFDLDRFKTINDCLGHSVGDILLTEVAGRLSSCAREQDTVARLGGDEFLIVLNGVKDATDMTIAAKRFMDCINSSFEIHGRPLSVGCSLGISIFPDHGTDAETLIKHADAAMYAAKDSGRNNFQFFSADMHAAASERLALESGLRSALAKNEMYLLYQPQMDVITGRVLGVEALLRWKHPQLGLVAPDRFIRIAENSGLILPIGEWVLKTACSDAQKWRQNGFPVAVNVSAVQFRHNSFGERVKDILNESGLSPSRLELELTESLLLADVDLTLSVLEELKGMGLRLAIDDFGTGYSNLSYLKRLPVTKIKIDRSFIQDVSTDTDDAAITTAIISMAKSLNLTVIAEGVENKDQLTFLRTQHCDGIQGYYFSRPVPVEEIVTAHFMNRTSALQV